MKKKKSENIEILFEHVFTPIYEFGNEFLIRCTKSNINYLFPDSDPLNKPKYEIISINECRTGSNLREKIFGFIESCFPELLMILEKIPVLKRNDHIRDLISEVRELEYYTFKDEYLFVEDIPFGMDPNNYRIEEDNIPKKSFKYLCFKRSKIDGADKNEHEKILYQAEPYAKEWKNSLEYLIRKFEDTINNIDLIKYNTHNVKKSREPVNSFEYLKKDTDFSNITDLHDALINGSFIYSNSSLSDFRKLFLGDTISLPITWISHMQSLSYFIKQLHVQKKVKDTKKRKWEITARCFIKPGGQIFDRTKLSQQKDPADTSKIDEIINLL